MTEMRKLMGEQQRAGGPPKNYTYIRVNRNSADPYCPFPNKIDYKMNRRITLRKYQYASSKIDDNEPKVVASQLRKRAYAATAAHKE